MTQTYSEKLRNPLWQKCRLFILNRDNFTCTICGDSETELHIHHEEYSGDPWNAPKDKLKTVCKDCHAIIEFHKKDYKRCILSHKYKISPDEIHIVSIFLDNKDDIFILIDSIRNGIVEPIITILKNSLLHINTMVDKAIELVEPSNEL